MEKIIKYLVVTDSSSQSVTEKVQKYLDNHEGWQPYGPCAMSYSVYPGMAGSRFAQTLVIYDNPAMREIE